MGNKVWVSLIYGHLKKFVARNLDGIFSVMFHKISSRCDSISTTRAESLPPKSAVIMTKNLLVSFRAPNI